jgi:hypothetical protein
MITLLIPYYDKDMEFKKGVLGDCMASFAGKFDELIVIHDNETSQYEKLNKGMAMATNDFVVISNDDVQFRGGDLRHLCIDGFVTTPLINGMAKDRTGHIFCLPKNIWKDIGGFDTRYEHGYFDDNDFWFTLEKHGYPTKIIESVDVYHPRHGGTTLENIPNKGIFFENNRQKFVEKWGRMP